MDAERTTWVAGNPNDRSITGFRIRNGGARGPMSKSFFYAMDKAGLGPRIKTVLGKRIITPADEAEWQAAQDEPVSAKLRAARSELRSRAAKIGLKSPRHPANTRRRARRAAEVAP
jgi:hypothetical protein